MKKTKKNTPARLPEKARKISDAFKAASGKKVDLFVYGTLMHDNYVKLLINRKPESIPAKLSNYIRIAPPWSFPFIVKHYGAVTYGRILKNLTRDEIKILDEFEKEGVLYNRQTVIARTKESRQRCLTYMGNISALQHSFGKDLRFENRYRVFIQKKIDDVVKEISDDKNEMTHRLMHELSSSAIDEIIQSHFDGNYICSYIMIQALQDAKPPKLLKVLENKELLPYAGNYMRLASQHIILNQFVEKIRADHPEAVWLSEQYFRHGLAILVAFILYNRRAAEINILLKENSLDNIVPDRRYREYAKLAIDISDKIYSSAETEEIVKFVESNWYSTPTPLGAELEFSYLGKNAVNSRPGQDPVYDGFYWFKDFDMYHRTWRLGGHVDSHREITMSQERHRGFLEYALGRYNIVGDLSRPLFDCPWGMSILINEAVKFLDIPPHSLHISMALPKGEKSFITDRPHNEDDLACLMMLGGDIRPDPNGTLRAIRIYDRELETSQTVSINFSDRKYHFAKHDQDRSEASEVMEYKYMRLLKDWTDYECIIVTLKGYQLATKCRPLKGSPENGKELPEQAFLKKWAEKPIPVSENSIKKFIETVEKGIILENNTKKLDDRKQKIMQRIQDALIKKNEYIQKFYEK